MKSKSTIRVSLTAVFAAIYAVSVVFLAPISFQAFQIRIADALLPLAILFGWPAILGLSLGAFVANFFGGLGAVDIIGGSLANFVATLLAWKIARRKKMPVVFVGIAAEIVVVTLIVGSYLSYLLGIPIGTGILGVFIGSLVAIGVLGSILFSTLSRHRFTSLFRTLGLLGQSDEANS
jgi:uncharacterized membrane protein